jgi:hypothetical protein
VAAGQIAAGDRGGDDGRGGQLQDSADSAQEEQVGPPDCDARGRVLAGVPGTCTRSRCLWAIRDSIATLLV